MSDSKTVAISFAADTRELTVLAMFLLNSVQPKDRKEQRQYNRVFEELDLDRFLGLTNVKIDELPRTEETVSMTAATIEYMVEATNTEMHGAIVRIVTRFVDRAVDAKDAKA